MLNVKKLFTKILTDMKKCDKKTLLWENASPSSVFQPQTVSLDLTDYDAVEVVMTGGVFSTTKGNSCLSLTNEFSNVRQRYFYVDDGGVVFINASAGNGVTMNITNNINIPRKIYGIKGGGTNLS